MGHTGHDLGLASNMFLDRENKIGLAFAMNGFQEEKKSNTTAFPELEERIYTIVYDYL